MRQKFDESPEEKAEKAWLLADPLLAVAGKSFEEPGVLWKTTPDVAEELGVEVDLVDYSVDQLGNRLGLIYCSYYPEGEEDRYTTRRQFDKMVSLMETGYCSHSYDTLLTFCLSPFTIDGLFL